MLRRERTVFAAAVVVAIAVLLVYLRSVRNGFIAGWDDDTYILNNEHIRSFGLSLFAWASTAFYAANWHPLTWLSHAADHALWGLDPAGHHATNIVLHGANTAIVVLLAARLVAVSRASNRAVPAGDPDADRTALIAATVTGILFGLHPVHVESVAWVAERKDLLCAFFFLLSVLSYVDQRMTLTSRERGSRRYPAASLALFALALLSKPMAITLPCILLILDWYPLRRMMSARAFGAMLMEKTPFFLLSGASAVVTVLAQRAGNAIAPLAVYPLQERVLVAFQALAAYLGKMVWPASLSPYYAYPQAVSLFQMQFLVPVIIVIMATGCVLAVRRKYPFLLAAWSFYVVTLLPVLGIVQVGGQPMADRYTYLPSLGPFFLAGLGAAWAGAKAASARTGRKTLLRTAAAGAIVVTALLGYRTFGQIDVWRDSMGFWDYVIATDPRVGAVPYNIRGELLYRTGAYDRALDDLSRAIALSPEDPIFYNNRGVAWEKVGRTDAAVADYDRALELDPSYGMARYNRGILLFNLGRKEPALKDFSEAIALDPANATYYNNRAIVLDSMGDPRQALADLDRAIALAPDHISAYLNRGSIHARAGRKGPARSDFERACALGSGEGCRALQRLDER